MLLMKMHEKIMLRKKKLTNVIRAYISSYKVNGNAVKKEDASHGFIILGRGTTNLEDCWESHLIMSNLQEDGTPTRITVNLAYWLEHCFFTVTTRKRTFRRFVIKHFGTLKLHFSDHKPSSITQLVSGFAKIIYNEIHVFIFERKAFN